MGFKKRRAGQDSFHSRCILDERDLRIPTSFMDQKLWNFIGAPQCANYTIEKLVGNHHAFGEAVTLKSDLIEQLGLAGTSLLPDVYLFRDLIRDALTHRYNKLCFLTFAHICVALDYFLIVTDAHHDYEEGGLFDDIQVITRTRERFNDEIEAYRKWRASQSH